MTRSTHTRLAARPRPAHRRGGAIVKIVIAVGGLGAIGGLALAVMQSAKGDQTQPSATLEIYTVARASFDITTTANGELEAKNQIEIRNRLEQQATIVEIIEEGKTIEKGELLIKLNDDTILTNINEELLRVETARAELTQARAAFDIQVSENESALRQADLKVQLAELALRQWMEGEVKSKRQENELALDKARRELDRLKEKHEQSISLHAQGFLSSDELKRDELMHIEAEASLAKAKLADEIYEQFQFPKDEKQKTSDLEEARAELLRVERKNESQLATKTADLENRKRQLLIREERLAKLQQQLAACTMTAPSAGLVVYSTSMERGWGWGGEGPLQIGRQVFPNQLLIVLPDTSEMLASVKVHESMAGRIRPGLPATVKIEAAGGATFSGRVTSIGVLAESSGRWMDPNLREYTVKIELDGVRGSGLKPSMRCEAEINLGRVEDAIAVPVQAVFNEGALRYVYVPSGGKFVRRPIRMGRRSDKFVEVSAGLELGERVLLRQPTAGEVLDRKWTDAELAAVNMRLNEEGKVEPIPGQGAPGGPGGPRPGGQAATRTPAGSPTAPASANKPAPETKPAETTVASAAENGEPATPDSGEAVAAQPAESTPETK